MQGTTLLFSQNAGTDLAKPRSVAPRSQSAITFENCYKLAGVKSFGFHALVATPLPLLADTHKVSAKTIQPILRHKKVTTTERYMQNINRDLGATINLLSEKGYQERLPNNSKGLGNES
jgi:integrase